MKGDNGVAGGEVIDEDNSGDGECGDEDGDEDGDVHCEVNKDAGEKGDGDVVGGDNGGEVINEDNSGDGEFDAEVSDGGIIGVAESEDDEDGSVVGEVSEDFGGKGDDGVAAGDDGLKVIDEDNDGDGEFGAEVSDVMMVVLLELLKVRMMKMVV